MTVSQLRKELESFRPDTPVQIEHPHKPIVQDLTFVAHGRNSKNGAPSTSELCILSTLTDEGLRRMNRKYPELVQADAPPFPDPVPPPATPPPPERPAFQGKFGHNVFSVIIERCQGENTDDHTILAELIAAPIYRLRPREVLTVPHMCGSGWGLYGCESYDEVGCISVKGFDPRLTTPAHLAIDMLRSFISGSEVRSSPATREQRRIWKPGRWWLDSE